MAVERQRRVDWRAHRADLRRLQLDLRDLVNQWDPLGVAEFAPEDEYDCLVGPLLSKLAGGADAAVIGEYLRHELEGHFGLDRYRVEVDATADRLVAWWVRSGFAA